MAGKLHPKDQPRNAPSYRIQHVSPLARLKAREVLNVWEETAADEFIAAYAMMTGSPVKRDADLGIPIGEARHDAADDSAARRSDLTFTYRQWKTDLLGTMALSITTGILIGETSMRLLEHHWSIRNGGAMKHLLIGLRHFASLRGNVPRDARGWRYSGSKGEAA